MDMSIPQRYGLEPKDLSYQDLCMMQPHMQLLYYLTKGTLQVLNSVCMLFSKGNICKSIINVSNCEDENIHRHLHLADAPCS